MGEKPGSQFSSRELEYFSLKAKFAGGLYEICFQPKWIQFQPIRIEHQYENIPHIKV
jgi:hypothetical protein